MLNRIKAMKIMLISFTFMFLSFVIVSMNGAVNGQKRFYETFFVLNANYCDDIIFIIICTFIFLVSFFIFLMSNLFILNDKKLILYLKAFLNICGFILAFYYCYKKYYMKMMIVVCAYVAINIILLSTNGVKRQNNIFIIVSTLIIMFINIYTLCDHIIISIHWKLCGLNDIILNRIIYVSRLNVFLFGLYFIPCIIKLNQDLKIHKNYKRI